MNVLPFCYKGNKQIALKQLLVFPICLLRKKKGEMDNSKNGEKTLYFADQPIVVFILSCQ